MQAAYLQSAHSQARSAESKSGPPHLPPARHVEDRDYNLNNRLTTRVHGGKNQENAICEALRR
jgi:hypothetical protein